MPQIQKSIFSLQFFEVENLSYYIRPNLKFLLHILDISLEARESQISYLGPSFWLNIVFENMAKHYPYLS